MKLRLRHLFMAAVLGGLVASALPVAAAQVGDAFRLGQVNTVNASTSLRGDTPANLVIHNTGSGVPLSLKNRTGGVPNGKPPLAVDSRRLVKNLNVDKVDFFDANELVRAAFGSSSNVIDANGTAVTATIEAPRPGILVMGGSIEAFGNTYDSWGCRLKVDDNVVSGTSMFSSTNFEGGEHTRNYNEDCSTDGAQVVDKGNHKVTLDIYLLDSVGLFEAAVWVIFVPFDGTGAVVSPPATEPATAPADEPVVPRPDQAG